MAELLPSLTGNVYGASKVFDQRAKQEKNCYMTYAKVFCFLAIKAGSHDQSYVGPLGIKKSAYTAELPCVLAKPALPTGRSDQLLR